MNSIEDQLREALRQSALDSPISPDAWDRTVARSRRRPVRVTPRWSRIMIPLAAAVAVVAIVVGATALTGHGAPSGATGSRTASPAPARTPASPRAPAPPGPGSYLIKSDPPSSAIVPVKLGAGQQTTWTFVWFGPMKSDPGEGIQVCTVTDGDGYYGSGGCAPPGLQTQQGFVEGTGTIKLVVSDRQVTSVTAQLPDGRSAAAVSASGRGFPDKVWLVDFPEEDSATIVMRDAAGTVLKRLSITGQYPTPSQPHSGGIKMFSYPAGTITSTAGTVTAYLLNGSLIGIKGQVVGFWESDSSSEISSHPTSAPQLIVNIGGSWMRGAKVAEYFGYAHANVARLALRLPDGRQYDAQTSAAWPGSGLRLWHFAVPIDAANFKLAQQIVLGYNASGQLVWQKPISDFN